MNGQKGLDDCIILGNVCIYSETLCLYPKIHTFSAKSSPCRSMSLGTPSFVNEHSIQTTYRNVVVPEHLL